LIGNPKIIFADEPTGNLDSVTSREVMELMTKMVKEHGQTLLIVTHDPAMAEFADRIVTIQDGNILDIKSVRKETTES
jgi:putative ABC transport system ATP-binding protein